MTTTRPEFIFYYSKHCTHCRELINMIKTDENLSKNIEYIDVCKKIQINLSTYLYSCRSRPATAVPTILYQDKLYTGRDAFNLMRSQLKIPYAVPV